MGRVLIQGGVVLTLGAKTPNFAKADVLIEDDVVAEIGPDLRARDAEHIDASNAIVMPGFVDTHRHVWKSLFRNLGDSGEAEQLGPHLNPDDVYAATMIGLLGAVEAGTTTVVDWADIPNGSEFADAALQAHADAGLRTILVDTIPFGSRETSADAATGELRRLADAVTGPTTTLASGHSDARAADRQQIADSWGLARELGLRVHAHAGVNPEDKGVVAGLAGEGLLGSDVTLIHCTNLDDTDLDAISSSGASVALTPSSEMARGLGAPPVQAFIDRTIRPGLGVDDDRLGPGDMLAQMRATISLQHATYFDLKLAGKAGLPNLLTTREVIRYATIDGARAVGLDNLTGSLEVGKQADVIVLRTDRPNIFPINDPIGAVVWGVDTSNVDWVFAAGRPLVREGELAADTSQARRLAIDARRRVTGDAGPPSNERVGLGAET